ncbi:MAG TPA: serine/threonine-protein kinase, partial [Gemmatimonadales bacterium]|nr:serine/threonine-protein kinase [Gemmatimonadales bacterium]
MTDPIPRLAEALAGRYRIERELGAGGMATVYLAEDLRHHRQVALKVLKPELTAALGADRFAREIEIAASLHHPHILPLFDSGEAVISRESRPTALLYYVMPFVEGESLRARLARERQLPVEDALRITADIADALAYAHQRGLIHRDVKPENILLEGGHGMLMDFGIARALSSNETQRLTDSGLVVGTPIYMSPEQASGERKLDGRSDQYALACVLYEMLAGQPPFVGATVEALVRQHVMAPVPPVTQFRPMVSPAVTEALTRALAKSPADRFATASDFSAALTSSISTSATSKSSGAPAARRPNRVLLAAAGGLLVLLVVAAWLVIRRDRAPAASAREAGYSIAVLPFESIGNDSSDAAFVAGVHGDIITQLGKIPAFQVASRTAVRNYQAGSKPDRDIAADLGVSVLLTGSVQRSGGQVHVTVALEDAEHDRQLWADSYDRPLTAENVFAIQGDIARQVANALRVQLSPGEDSAVSAVATTNLAALELYYRAIASRDSIGIYGPDTLT